MGKSMTVHVYNRTVSRIEGGPGGGHDHPIGHTSRHSLGGSTACLWEGTLVHVSMPQMLALKAKIQSINEGFPHWLYMSN